MTTTNDRSAADAILKELADRDERISNQKPQPVFKAVQTQRAQADRDAAKKLAALSENDSAGATANVKKLTRTAFGTSDLTRSASPAEAASMSISSRDAADRVSQIEDPQAAAAILRQAEVSNDELLARAVGAHAHGRGQEASAAGLKGISDGWDGVLQEFVSNRPVQGQAVNALRDLNSSGPPSVAQLFRYAKPTHSDLAGLSDVQIEALAADPDGLLG